MSVLAQGNNTTAADDMSSTGMLDTNDEVAPMAVVERDAATLVQTSQSLSTSPNGVTQGTGDAVQMEVDSTVPTAAVPCDCSATTAPLSDQATVPDQPPSNTTGEGASDTPTRRYPRRQRTPRLMPDYDDGADDFFAPTSRKRKKLDNGDAKKGKAAKSSKRSAAGVRVTRTAPACEARTRVSISVTA